jgi:APA family basic amino acid/polyamine antiporter
MLPAVLAPEGVLSFGGWLLSGAGSFLLALALARLATRTKRTGGPYVFAHDAFGDLTGFLVAWGYWASYWIAIPAVAIAFVGYLTVFVPALSSSASLQASAALALIWALTLVAIRSTRESALVQIVMTVLKLVPLALVIGLGFTAGDTANLPALNPSQAPTLSVLAATALLTMWAFVGLEAGVVPAGSVKDPERTMPRAVVAGTIMVTLIYLAATAAVMLLVPADQLAASTSTFADAARGLGAWGPTLIAAGALVATAGTLNGLIFIAGQMPMAVALDRLAPAVLAKCNARGGPYVSLLISSALGSALLLLNYSRGLVGAFTFLIIMSTLAAIVPLLFSALAEVKFSWRSARGWAAIAALAAAFIVFAIVGSGLEALIWGLVLLVVGIPFYYFGRQRAEAVAATAD